MAGRMTYVRQIVRYTSLVLAVVLWIAFSLWSESWYALASLIAGAVFVMTFRPTSHF